MRAIDTNVVVRLIALDDPAQCAIAEDLTRQRFILLPTVLLEAVWVLQSRYKVSSIEIVKRLRLLIGSPNAETVSAEPVLWAIARYADGADFADALHLALADEAQATSFATFDAGIDRIAAPLRVETLG